MRELALFAGAGGGILGGKLLGWRTVCAVEIDGYARSVLMARQNDGILEPFPIWDDVRTFDGKRWRGLVDVVSGGFPCQDISIAGKGAGITGARSGLWGEMARIIGEVSPSFVFVENSPMLIHRGLETVLRDLAQMGFNAEWCCLGANDAGAPHKRERIWILACADCKRLQSERAKQQTAKPGIDGADGADTKGAKNHGRKRGDMAKAERCRESFNATVDAGCEDVADSDSLRMPTGIADPQAWHKRNSDQFNHCGPHVPNADRSGCVEQRRPGADGKEHGSFEWGGWWESEPELGRVANGVANRVDRLKCIGNGQVPAVVRLAWETMTGRI